MLTVMIKTRVLPTAVYPTNVNMKTTRLLVTMAPSAMVPIAVQVEFALAVEALPAADCIPIATKMSTVVSSVKTMGTVMTAIYAPMTTAPTESALTLTIQHLVMITCTVMERTPVRRESVPINTQVMSVAVQAIATKTMTVVTYVRKTANAMTKNPAPTMFAMADNAYTPLGIIIFVTMVYGVMELTGV
jgi:hypothetical protein